MHTDFDKALERLKRWQPTAERVRYEGKCPNCKRDYLYSYSLPDFIDKPAMRLKRGLDRKAGEALTEADFEEHVGYERCGYFCSNCRWGNAGRREKLGGSGDVSPPIKK